MPINLNLKVEKKHLYLFSAIIIFLVGVGVVIGYGGNQPSVHGHDLGELNLTGFSGGGGYYVPSDVKATTATHNGNFGGYKLMNDWIQTNGCLGYHVCDNIELIKYITQTGANPTEGWVNEGGGQERHRDGSLDQDCKGWTSITGGDYGAYGVYWVTTDKYFTSNVCATSRAVLCCK